MNLSECRLPGRPGVAACGWDPPEGGKVAASAGVEPASAGVRVRCLAIWLRGDQNWWCGLDLNQRRGYPADLQSASFSHSDTAPKPGPYRGPDAFRKGRWTDDPPGLASRVPPRGCNPRTFPIVNAGIEPALPPRRAACKYQSHQFTSRRYHQPSGCGTRTRPGPFWRPCYHYTNPQRNLAPYVRQPDDLPRARGPCLFCSPVAVLARRSGNRVKRQAGKMSKTNLLPMG